MRGTDARSARTLRTEFWLKGFVFQQPLTDRLVEDLMDTGQAEGQTKHFPGKRIDQCRWTTAPLVVRRLSSVIHASSRPGCVTGRRRG
jgi:hypothetical protein